MSTRTNATDTDSLHDLIGAVAGSVHLPGVDQCARARSAGDDGAAPKSGLVVKCRSVSQVRLAVHAARLRNLPLCVRGAGHDWVGKARHGDGLVIDLSSMRGVAVDPVAQVATVEGGATVADVSKAAQRHGLVAVTTHVSTVGMAGLTLGGGYGALTPRFGLALDNLLSANVVLEDGSLVSTDSTHHGELFWALRGGGGNFGIVVSMRIQLHAVDKILGGAILFPWSEARAVLQGYSAFMSSAPDELSVLAGVIPTPDDQPAILLAPAWCGDAHQGLQAIAQLHSLATPLRSTVTSRSYADMLAMYDAQVVTGKNYSVQTRWLPALSADAIDALIGAGRARVSPSSGIVIQHFHGAGTRVATQATAFGLRRRHFMIEIVAAWESAPGEDGAIHRRWARDLSTALEPLAIPGGYPDLLTPDAYERVDAAYGCNALRLRRLKRRFDPDDVFSCATALPG